MGELFATTVLNGPLAAALLLSTVAGPVVFLSPCVPGGPRLPRIHRPSHRTARRTAPHQRSWGAPLAARRRRALGVSRALSRLRRTLQIVGGSVLIAIGLLLVTGVWVQWTALVQVRIGDFATIV